MTRNSFARFHREQSQIKLYSVFMQLELDYILSDSSLREMDKIVWICLRNMSHLHPEMSYQITQESLGERLGKKANTIYKALKVLVNAGYVKISTSSESRVNSYAVCMPAQALKVIEASKERSGRKKEGSKAIEDFKAQVSPVVSASTQPAPKQNEVEDKDSNALMAVHEKYEAGLNQIKQENPSGSPSEIHQKANKLLSEEESLMHHQYLTELSKQEDALCNVAIRPIQQSMKPTGQTSNKDFVTLQWCDEYYLIERKVKEKVVNSFQSLYFRGGLDTKYQEMTFDELMKEVLYYIVRAGSQSSQKTSQLQRYYIAIKLLKQGQWQRPNGLQRLSVLTKEAKWQGYKKQEQQSAMPLNALLERGL